jgi:hypothetical protein
MNCCNDYGECHQGKDCPVRESVDNLTAITLDSVFGLLRNMLAGVGILAVIMALGFWSVK